MRQDWLRARSQATPQAIALIIGEQSWRYAEIDILVDRCVAQLLAQGVTPQQNIAILMPNNLLYICLIHALARLGAVLVPLNSRLTARELGWQLDYTGAALLLYSDETEKNARSIESTCCVQTAENWLQDDMTANSSVHEHFQIEAKAMPLDLDALQAIVFTSGTTGFPKGAMLTFANHFWGATASSFRLGLQTDDRWLSCLPLYHVGGLAVIFRSCLYGTAVVLHDRFEMEAFIRSLDSQQVTLTSLVPTMLHRLLAAYPEYQWPSSLRLVLLGGAATSPELIEQCHSINLPIAVTYGLTESASQVATMRPEDVLHKPGSVGKPLLFSSVRIADEPINAIENEPADHTDRKAVQSLPPGKLGEIVVRGPTVFAGYYKNPEATAKTLRRGELFTGDIGYLDKDGDLWLVQRRSDIIITGGENVYPNEVESILCKHPAVARACVVGIPDPEWGHRVVAMVTLRAQHHLTEEQLCTFSRHHLAGYKQPRAVVFVERLPQTASGKIERRTVAEQLHQQLNRFG